MLKRIRSNQIKIRSMRKSLLLSIASLLDQKGCQKEHPLIFFSKWGGAMISETLRSMSWSASDKSHSKPNLSISMPSVAGSFPGLWPMRIANSERASHPGLGIASDSRDTLAVPSWDILVTSFSLSWVPRGWSSGIFGVTGVVASNSVSPQRQQKVRR